MNPVDKFRNDYLDKIIQEEQKKKEITFWKQMSCFHRYEAKGFISYEDWTLTVKCVKCGSTKQKRLS